MCRQIKLKCKYLIQHYLRKQFYTIKKEYENMKKFGYTWSSLDAKTTVATILIKEMA